MHSADLRIDGSTRLVGLIGSNISHTLSPAIHNYSAKILGLNCVYLPMDIDGSFPETCFFKVMWEIGAFGFNITVPYKEIAAKVFALPPVTSVNTIYRGERGWLGDSTDGPGFVRGLSESGIELLDIEAVIFLGNGGAALAIYQFLSRTFLGIRYFILRRNSARDPAWMSINGGHNQKILEFLPRCLAELITIYPQSLVIQCTSAPLSGQDLTEFAQVMNYFPGVLVDLIYGRKSALLEKAKKLGIRHQDGKSMLIGQALLSQELWWGQSVSYSNVKALLESSD